MREAFDGRTNDLKRLDALGLFRPTRKRHPAQIAGETDAAGHDDAIMRTGAPGGFNGRTQEIVYAGGHAVGWLA